VAGPGARCTRYQPGVMCDARREAMRRGEMYFSLPHRGWIFPADNRRIPQLLRDEHRQAYVWTFCPMCLGSLPDDVSAVERLLTEPPPGDDGPE
jgi:hypothetical protein